MNVREKYRDEFLEAPIATLNHSDERNLLGHQVCVCITPKGDAKATLVFAWEVARELAQWIILEFPASAEFRFQIIVAWSQHVRPQQGQIFKIWGLRDRMRLIARCSTYDEYVRESGDMQTPMRRWEKDVFQPKNA